jgi:tRNA 5-methylaminomethyl-2-thiouridine biosynthesis bifunctional protein
MKTQPIIPARIDFSDPAAPFAADFGDVYHSRSGALAQARHVFLGGNRLPQRWQGCARFVVLETGFGLGNNFLATWAAWRDDPQRCERLHVISIEKHPPRREDLERAHAGSELRALADQLIRAWPALTPNLHPLGFEDGRVQLLLALGDAADWLPELVAEVDAFYLDGFAPSKNPQMWDRRLTKALGRLATPGATAATWSVAREVRDGLSEAGFVVERAPGFSGKREMTAARYAPAFTPRRPPSRLAMSGAAAREAVVIGAGLAGAGVAHALAGQGVRCTVIDRHPLPASETSGNPAGLFHGVVTPEDGAHARFNRAAALLAQRVYGPLLVAGTVPGRCDGLLRLEAAQVDAMQALLDRQGLPADYLQAVSAGQASALAGMPLGSAAWFYPGGGWLSPPALARHWLCTSPDISFRGGVAVQGIRRVEEQWQVLDADGAVCAQAPVLVVAAGADGLALLGQPDWPLETVRGQITLLPGGMPGLPPPRRPVAGSGYAITLPAGNLLCGATTQAGDHDRAARDEDHLSNLAQLARMTGQPFTMDPARLQARVGFRLASDDRLPVLGPVPLAEALLQGQRLEQPRLVMREPGLHVLTALGSRGITWAPLAAQTLAAWIAGAPLPLEASLLDTVDAARFVSRRARQAERQRAAGSVQPPPSAR